MQKVILGKAEQQGDVLMFPVVNHDEVLKVLTNGKSTMLVHQTTHQSNQHRIKKGTMTQFDGDFFLTGSSEVQVTHVEHDRDGETPLVLSPNTLYLKEIVNEFDHIANELRKVID